MKKLLAFCLVFVLCALTGAVLGEAPAEAPAGPDPYVPSQVNIFMEGWEISPVEETTAQGVNYEATFDGGAMTQLEISLEDEKTHKFYDVVYNKRGKIVAAEYSDGKESYSFDGKVWTDAAGEKVKGPDLAFMKKHYNAFRVKGTWYTHNTMSLVGLSLREMNPSLTNKWYHVVPVDLSKDAVHIYRTAASNLYYMGICTVTVRDGKVTVDYTLPKGQITLEDQCMAWFTDLSQITTGFLENPVSSFRYGQPVDIEEELGGAKTALLFMCNHVSYQVPLTAKGLSPLRFYASTNYVVDLRKELTALLEGMKQ